MNNIANAKSVALVGIDGHVVDVQAISTMGLPTFVIVGLPDKSLAEATDRIRPAFNYAGFKWPQKRVTVNLSPASIPKFGPIFDLSIAVALLSTFNEVKNKNEIEETIFLGELGIDGSVKPVKGILPAVICAKEKGHKNIVVSSGNSKEASLVGQMSIKSVSSIQELAKMYGNDKISVPNLTNKKMYVNKYISSKKQVDMKNVLGQTEAKMGLEIAAAGRHNVLMTGPPGTGKSMLASAFCSILPDLQNDESTEITKVLSIAGFFDSSNGLVKKPPFENPHHSATTASIIGGGTGIAVPGAVSRAHKGVLFLDEAAEFSTSVLQTLRQPLESGEVIIHRAKGIVKYPADFQLLMATNPCPCGKWTPADSSSCSCSSIIRRKYFNKISGPLIDRMDLSFEVGQIKDQKVLSSKKIAEDSATIKARVEVARKKQEERLKNTPWRVNSEVPGSYLRRISKSEVISILEKALNESYLTMRGVDRALRVAWTICDLKELAEPGKDEIMTAIGLKIGNAFL